MIKKTKFSTITAVVATIAAIAALGGIGGGIGFGQQQMALAQVDSRDIGGDVADLRDIGHAAIEDDLENTFDNIRGLCLSFLPLEVDCQNVDFLPDF